MPYVLNGHETSGATANRPTNAEAGFQFYDTTIGATVTWDGTAWSDAAGEIAAVGGIEATAQTVTPAADSGAGSTILPGVTAVTVAAVTNDADDWIVLPAFADIPIGHEIVIDCAAGGNFEMRTVAASGTTINGVDSDGTQEYLCTDTETITVTKHADGYVATALTALGAVATAVIPD